MHTRIPSADRSTWGALRAVAEFYEVQGFEPLTAIQEEVMAQIIDRETRYTELRAFVNKTLEENLDYEKQPNGAYRDPTGQIKGDIWLDCESEPDRHTRSEVRKIVQKFLDLME